MSAVDFATGARADLPGLREAVGVTVTVHAAQVRVAVHASTRPESVDLLLDVLVRA